MNSFNKPKPLKLNGNIDENFRVFNQEITTYFNATKTHGESNPAQIARLFNLIGSDALKIYNIQNIQKITERDTVEILMQKFQQFFCQKNNNYIVFHKFFSRNQHIDESFDSYLMNLRELIKQCKFKNDENSILKNKIILGIQNKDVREKLLQDDLSLEETIEYCQTVEAVEQNRKILEQSSEIDLSFKISLLDWKTKSENMEMSSKNSNLIFAEIRHSESPPQKQCSICCQELKNKCHTDSCFHMFCFECLKKRVIHNINNQKCPLCAKTFRYIHHSFTESGIPYKYYDIFENSVHSLCTSFKNKCTRTIRMSTGGGFIRVRHIPPIYGQRKRIIVYDKNLWSEPLSNSRGQFRNFSVHLYRNNRLKMFKPLHHFIYREIIAIRSLEVPPRCYKSILYSAFNEKMTTFILELIGFREISMLTNILRPYFHAHTEHFCHELFNFANSPYNLVVAYDCLVKYTSKGDEISDFSDSDTSSDE